jgi:predicted nicotinamide N-methyase
MDWESKLETFSFGEYQVQLLVPLQEEIREHYRLQKEIDDLVSFPYWAQVWPASKALCSFISNYPQLLKQKRVLELAAGLGLPSLLATQLASSVSCSDNHVDAVAQMQHVIDTLRLQNIDCFQLDWSEANINLSADVVLLSDINYDPSQFELLYRLIVTFLTEGSTVLLSTPQRLMAKSFIQQLLPFCIHQEEYAIGVSEEIVYCSVMVLAAGQDARQQGESE